MLRATPGVGGVGAALGAIREFAAADPQQVIAFSVLGGRADLGLMALGPDLDALDLLTKRVLAGPFEVVFSFFSLTENSEYTSSEADERARLDAAGEPDVEGALARWSARMEAYLDARLHPRMPQKAVIAFYPMSKRRAEGANWYSLPFEERKALMQGHATVGRRYAGRVVQLITGATGLDDFEWGVTLVCDDPATIKEIVYEMRFDEVTARYGEFGPFFVGLVMDAPAAFARAGVDSTD
jgi:chlorite dismutase